MRVERWINYKDAMAMGMNEAPISTLGGWFPKGKRWEDYLSLQESVGDCSRPYFEALRQEIITRNIRRGGDWHQNSEEGVPIFSDGTFVVFSYRAWGDLLAAVWSTEENKDYEYMNFYMDCLISEVGG